MHEPSTPSGGSREKQASSRPTTQGACTHSTAVQASERTARPQTASCSAGTGTLSVRGRVRDKDGGVTEYDATVDAGTSYDGLCALTRALSGKSHVAAALCRTLAKAEHAKKARKRRAYPREYRRGVRAQTGKKRSKAFSLADGAPPTSAGESARAFVATWRADPAPAGAQTRFPPLRPRSSDLIRSCSGRPRRHGSRG
jgi:hypothetical protein